MTIVHHYYTQEILPCDSCSEEAHYSSIAPKSRDSICGSTSDLSVSGLPTWGRDVMGRSVHLENLKFLGNMKSLLTKWQQQFLSKKVNINWPAVLIL